MSAQAITSKQILIKARDDAAKALEIAIAKPDVPSHDKDALIKNLIDLADAVSKYKEDEIEIQTHPVYMGRRKVGVSWAVEHWVLKTQGFYLELYVNGDNTFFSMKKENDRRNQTIANILIGKTFLTPGEIRNIGENLIETEFKTYRMLSNNCQHFANRLLKEITNGGMYITGPNIGLTGSRMKKFVSMIDSKGGGLILDSVTAAFIVMALLAILLVFIM